MNVYIHHHPSVTDRDRAQLACPPPSLLELSTILSPPLGLVSLNLLPVYYLPTLALCLNVNTPLAQFS